MKIIALLLSIVALVSSAYALKNPVCGLQHEQKGQCRGYYESWSYKPETKECTKFVYGGCDGNDNRFDSAEECERVCKE